MKKIVLFLIMFYFNNLYSKKIDDLDPKNYYEKAKIIIIDKILGDSIKQNPIIEKNKIFKYKRLEIILESCWLSPSNNKHSGAMIMINEIMESKKIEDLPNHKSSEDLKGVVVGDLIQKIQTIFHGWIFNDNRVVSHLEHPLYQVYLESCVK